MTSKSKTNTTDTYIVVYALDYTGRTYEKFVRNRKGREAAARWFARWHKDAIILSVRKSR